MAGRPNILFVLADDMGFSDIGCFGSEIRTPALDELARGGVRQTQFYNCARCCPTRASILTGVYPHKAGIGAMVRDEGHPAYRGFIRPEIPTVAERLREAGYTTWMSGKWHVGGEYAVHLPEQWKCAGDATHPLPTQRGFERFYGMLAGGCSYFNPTTLMDGDRFVMPRDLPDDFYLTTALGRRARGFVEACAGGGRPFFGYLAFTAPHWPLHAPELEIARYRGRYSAGWDALRRDRHQRLVDLGVIPRDLRVSDRDGLAPAWEDQPDKEWQAELMAVYAAQVTAMDRAIGEVVQTLKKTGQFENTLIVFCSDNGGCAEFLREDGEAGRWPEFYSLPTKRGTMCKVGNRRGVSPGPAETFMSYELPWANASNTPFRKFKAWTYEGGISTPLVASWPEGLPADVVRHGTGHVIDLVATACGVGGASCDGLDGASLLDLWQGRGGPEGNKAPLCWEHFGHAAIRRGNWKLVRSGQREPWELYDIDKDRIEQDDVSGRYGGLVAELAGQWQGWADGCGVRPVPAG